MMLAFGKRLWAARPGAVEALVGALLWGLVVTGAVLAGAVLARLSLPPSTTRIAAICFIGAAVSLPLALWLVRLMALPGASRVWSAAFVVLAAATLGITALVFAFDFWWYFAQWHGERFSKLWLVQLVFTFASAIYQFIVMGVRLYVPFGVAALAIAAWMIARRVEPRATS